MPVFFEQEGSFRHKKTHRRSDALMPILQLAGFDEVDDR